MPSLTLKFKENVIGRFPVLKGKSLTIGRRKDNDVVIDNLAVSGHHAKVDAVGDAFVLVDLQSKNGSFVN
jgi:pSer/pThr/pTyr-binding forkhead associated (FHA) protein